MAGKRANPNSRAQKRGVTANPSELETRYDAANIVQPGAHPERGTMRTGLANPIDVIKGLLKRKPKKGK